MEKKEIYNDTVDYSADLMEKYFPKGECKERGKALAFNAELITYVMQKLEQEIDKAREEGKIEVLKDMQKVWDNDNLGDAPKYGRAGAGLMKRWIRDDINERLSKLTTK